jgi:phosphodiesterase/alkaline phosphatase D-like protein
VQFSPELREGVASGAITVSYRLWSRPKVKVGGVYRSGEVTIEVDDVELVPFASITEADLALTGEADVEALRRRAAHAGPIDDDTLVYRVEFHVLTPPPRPSPAARVRRGGGAARSPS